MGGGRVMEPAPHLQAAIGAKHLKRKTTSGTVINTVAGGAGRALTGKVPLGYVYQ